MQGLGWCEAREQLFTQQTLPELPARQGLVPALCLAGAASLRMRSGVRWVPFGVSHGLGREVLLSPFHRYTR